MKSFQQNKEYEQMVKVEKIPIKSEPVVETKTKVVDGKVVVVEVDKDGVEKKDKKVKIDKKNKQDKKIKKKVNMENKEKVSLKKKPTPKAIKRLPEIEDDEGFNGRRPIVDPFRVGEKTTLALTYFNMAAGYMDLEVLPMAQVNGKKSYHFKITIKSSKLFSMFYSVEDWAETFLDYEEMRPYTLTFHIKESKQLKEIRGFFDWKTNTGNFWQKKITNDREIV